MAYRATARTEARKADTRRRIYEAARALAAQDGFEALQVSAVAARSGVATGTIYRYFPSKAALCAEVVRLVSEREIGLVAEIAERSVPAAQRLGDAIRAFAGRALQGRATAYALIAKPAEPLVERERQAHIRALRRVFETILADGMADGSFRPQAAEIGAACVVGAMMEALLGPLAPRATSTPPLQTANDPIADDPIVDAVVDFALQAVQRLP